MSPPQNVRFGPDAVDRENVYSRCSRIGFRGAQQSFADKTNCFESSIFPFFGGRLWLTVFLHGLLTRQDDQLLTFWLPSGPGRPWGWIGRPQLLCTGIGNGDGRGAPVYVKRVLEAGLLIKHRCLSKCSSLAVFITFINFKVFCCFA